MRAQQIHRLFGVTVRPAQHVQHAEQKFRETGHNLRGEQARAPLLPLTFSFSLSHLEIKVNLQLCVHVEWSYSMTFHFWMGGLTGASQGFA